MQIGFSQLLQFSASDTRLPVIIVGSGAVGLFLGVRLAERGMRVLVLESGDRNLGGFDTGSFTSAGRRHQGIQISRSRSLGGTTNLWGGQLVEFMPADLEQRAWRCGAAWPVPFEQLAAYYHETYEALSIPRGIIDDDQVWDRLGMQRPLLGDELEVFLTRWMRVPNLAVLYGAMIESDENLTVATGATVNGLTFAGKRIDAVDVCDGVGGRIRLPAHRVVLAAGTIENARLMLHAATAMDCPWKHNRLLGACFQDHLGGRIADVIPQG